MLVLVRHLSPSDYGSMAMAQAVVGFISFLSFVNFSAHVLQIRHPSDVDWQAQFTAGTVMNVCCFAITLLVSWLFTMTQRYAQAALPLAVLAFAFLLDIPAILRNRMAQVEHDWERYRLLNVFGTLLALPTALVLALYGAGVWALAIQPLLFGLPATIDLVWKTRWRPDWSWSWKRYRNTARFTFSRVAIGLLSAGRGMTEQTTMAGVYNFAALGVFSRAVGLATMGAGRLGQVATSAIYPVITRAEEGSAEFRRYAALVLSGVCWATICAAVFIALASRDLVALLYGSTWNEVAPLLPLAATSVAANGILATITSLLLANNEVRACFWLDVATTGPGIAVALWLIPMGASTYLAGLAALNLALILIGLFVLCRRNAVDIRGLTNALVPGLVAGGMAVIAVFLARRAIGANSYLLLRLLVDGIAVVLAYALTLRTAFAGPLSELVSVIPGGQILQRLLLLNRRAFGTY